MLQKKHLKKSQTIIVCSLAILATTSNAAAIFAATQKINSNDTTSFALINYAFRDAMLNTTSSNNAREIGMLEAINYDATLSKTVNGYETRLPAEEATALAEIVAVWNFCTGKNLSGCISSMSELADGVAQYYISTEIEGELYYLSVQDRDNGELTLTTDPTPTYVTKNTDETSAYFGMIYLSSGSQHWMTPQNPTDYSYAVNLDNGKTTAEGGGFGTWYAGEDEYFYFILATIGTYDFAESIDLDNISVNLFDYWLTDRENPANGSDYCDGNDNEIFCGTPSNTYDALEKGINSGHALKFLTAGHDNNLDNFWNFTTLNGTTYDLVARTLGNDGYPYLNSERIGSDESLAYLFDPGIKNDYKVSYADVTGLLRDDNGCITFSATENYAEFNEATNSFLLYDTTAVKDGQFFPFNSIYDVYDITDENNKNTNDAILNHWFGMTITAEFAQVYNGYLDSAETFESIAEFAGDDDVWVFIDDALVIDLGGLHNSIGATINFATGEITYTYNGELSGDDPAAQAQAAQLENTTLKAMFEAAGVSTEEFKGETFADNTTHTLKMYFLERGNWDSDVSSLRLALVDPLEIADHNQPEEPGPAEPVEPTEPDITEEPTEPEIIDSPDTGAEIANTTAIYKTIFSWILSGALIAGMVFAGVKCFVLKRLDQID